MSVIVLFTPAALPVPKSLFALVSPTPNFGCSGVPLGQ